MPFAVLVILTGLFYVTGRFFVTIYLLLNADISQNNVKAFSFCICNAVAIFLLHNTFSFARDIKHKN